MSKNKSWTIEEDRILVQAIKAFPHNKQKAFKEAAKNLNRTINACSLRWYNHLSNPKSKNYAGCLFTMIGHSTRLDNRTICMDSTKPIKNKKNLWNCIKKLLGI